MALRRFFGDPLGHAATVDESGRWARWVAAQPGLGQVGSAAELVAVTRDRGRPVDANVLLLALVRVCSPDGGVDSSAAAFVCALLQPGAERLVGSLRGLGADVPTVLAGQLWLQVREYPWRSRPAAVARTVLLETRRAVLTEYGAVRRRGSGMVLLTEPVDPSVRSECCAPAPDPDDQVVDAELLTVLAWGRSGGVLALGDAHLLWDLAVGSDQNPSSGGLSTVAAADTVATTQGVAPRTVRRRRGEAVAALRVVRDQYVTDQQLAARDTVPLIVQPAAPPSAARR